MPPKLLRRFRGESVTMKNVSSVFVFAYGSNMCTRRMRSRVPTATPVTIGYVGQRKLMFHKRSDDGSGKADAALTACPSDRVWGVVYRLHPANKPVLDEHEFLGIGYDEQKIDVVHESGSLRAWMYVARREAIDSLLLPYSWYHDFTVHGACQHRLPESYVEYLRSFESLVDPDSERHAANRRLIGA